MTDYPTTTPREKPKEIVATLKSEKIAKLFIEGKKGAWINEKKAIEKKVPNKHKHLLNTMTSEDRENDGGYVTRTAMLLLTSGLEPGTPDFETAKDVMVELIKIYKPEVILWRLKDMDPGKFGNISTKQFADGLANGSIELPKDFEDNDVLADLDDYELVGDKNQKDRTQTPLQPIVDQIVGAIGKSVEKPTVKIKSVEPALPSPEPAPAPTMTPEQVQAESNALSTLRERIGVETTRKSTEAVEEKKIITPDDLEKAFENARQDKNVLNDANYRTSRDDVEDINNFLEGKSKYGDFDVKTSIDKMFNTGFFQILTETTNGESLFTLCQYVVQRSEADPNNNNIRTVALKILDQIANRTGEIYQKFGRPQILENSIDLAMVYMDKPKANKAFNLLSTIQNQFNKKISLGLTEDQIFNNNDLVEGMIATTFKGEQESKGNAWQFDEDCLPVFNSEKAQPFLKRIFDASEPKKGTEFFYRFQTRLDDLGYEVQERPVVNEMFKRTYKLIRKGVSKRSERPSSKSEIPQEEANLDELFTKRDEEIKQMAKQLEGRSFTNVAQIYETNQNKEERDLMLLVLRDRVGSEANKVLESEVDLSAIGVERSLVGMGFDSLAYNLTRLTLTKLKGDSPELLAKMQSNVEQEYNKLIVTAKQDNIPIPKNMSYSEFIEGIYENLGIEPDLSFLNTDFNEVKGPLGPYKEPIPDWMDATPEQAEEALANFTAGLNGEKTKPTKAENIRGSEALTALKKWREAHPGLIDSLNPDQTINQAVERQFIHIAAKIFGLTDAEVAETPHNLILIESIVQLLYEKEALASMRNDYFVEEFDKFEVRLKKNIGMTPSQFIERYRAQLKIIDEINNNKTVESEGDDWLKGVERNLDAEKERARASDWLNFLKPEKREEPKSAYEWLHELDNDEVQGQSAITNLITNKNSNLNIDKNTAFRQFDIQFRNIAQDIFKLVNHDNISDIINIEQNLAIYFTSKPENQEAGLFTLGMRLDTLLKKVHGSDYSFKEIAREFLEQYMKKVEEIDRSKATDEKKSKRKKIAAK